MRVSFFFAILICLHVSVSARSQDKVTLSIKNGRLETALQEIRKQTGYFYAFLDEWKDKSKPIDISVTNVSVEAALNICFKAQPFTYFIIGKTIVIKEKIIQAVLKFSAGALLDLQGQVLDEKQEPLEKASVAIKGEKRGTFTDSKGIFDLKQVPENATLLISFSGYISKEVPIHNKTYLTVALSQSTSSLDQVQIIAYGATTKRLNVGDVSTVKADELASQPVGNVLQALEGRVPGMFINQNNGFPGSGMRIELRGINSIAHGNEPLYIVDGVPFGGEVTNGMAQSVTITSPHSATSANPFSYINPADIESIDVLKDADATAIYGSRGANGVILVTTKKGKAGRTSVTLNLQSGIGQVGEKLSLLNTRHYLEMRNEAFSNDGGSPNPHADFDLTLWDTTHNTDWQKVLLGGTDRYNDVEASISGGNSITQFLIGAGYHKETTVFPGDFNDQKGSIHFNINNISPNKKLTIMLSGLYTVDKNLLPAFDLTQSAVTLPPDAPAIYNADGNINWSPSPAGSASWPGYQPAAQLLPKDNESVDNLVGNLVVNYQILPGLNLKSSFGYNNLQGNGTVSIPLTFFDPVLRAVRQRNSTFKQVSTKSWIIEPQLSYVKDIVDGKLTALIGSTIQQSNSNASEITATGFSNDLQLNDIAAATATIVNAATNNVYKYNAIFFRLGYNWKDQYLLNLIARRDGSSRFGPANQFHNFWAFGAGWIFSNTILVKDIFPKLSFGKIRGSYGTTGSDKIGDYSFMDLYGNIPNIGVPYQGAAGLIPTTLFTPNLAWEETKKLEGGLELGFFKDRIIITASYYLNHSGNQLVPYNLPSISGFAQVIKNLNAIVQNKGWEIEFKTINVKSHNFRWTSSFNFSLNRNKLASGAPGLSGYLQQKIGYPLEASFLFHSLEVDPITGVNQFADLNGKPTDHPNPATDMTALVDPTPKFYGGLQNTISYKRLELSFLFQFVDQPKASEYSFWGIPGSFSVLGGGSNQPVYVMRRWQKPGDVTTVERFSQNSSLQNSFNYAIGSDLIYGNGSYIRLKNLSLSWAFPDRWQKGAGLNGTHLFVHAQNLLTFTRYQGLDPENQSAVTLPPLRVITFGINTTL